MLIRMTRRAADILKQIDEQELHEHLIASISSMSPGMRGRVLQAIARAAAAAAIAQLDAQHEAQAIGAAGPRRKRVQLAAAPSAEQVRHSPRHFQTRQFVN
jgi:hypothetical protein